MLKVLLLGLCLFINAYAHKLNVFSNASGHHLFVQAYFANGKGCQSCKIRLEEKKRNVIIESVTNTKGEVTFFLEQGSYVLKVDAGSGHEFFDEITMHPTQTVQVVPSSNLKTENQALKNEVLALQEQLEWMNLLKTLLAIVAIIAIFGFLKRMKQ